MAKEPLYNEDKIQTLSSLEHIRKRPTMYIGRLGDGNHYSDGIYILIKEILDNALDEHMMGHGDLIEIDVNYESGRVRVRDYGRGIPLGKVRECVSVINTGAKYNQDVFKFSVGLNGVGTKAVNALSERFEVVSIRDRKKKTVLFENGELREEKSGKTLEENGVIVEFFPDRSLFVDYQFLPHFVSQMVWNYAYLNSHLTLKFNGETIHAPGGLLDLLKKEVDDALHERIIHYKSEFLEYSLVYLPGNYSENYYSFVNGHYTQEGGTHLSFFREAILKGVNDFFAKNFDGADVRNGLMGCLAIRVGNPEFTSQTKSKLSNSDIRSWLFPEVRQSISDFLLKNEKMAKAILEKIENNQKLRQELNAVRKKAKKASTSFASPQLKDCKEHFDPAKNKGLESTIFITEGQSAGGSMGKARNSRTQAIYCLRGKTLNVWEVSQQVIYKNDTFFNLIRALGIDQSVEQLRYNKVVIATDADVDGMHIRNLLITFFVKLYPEMIERGHLFILETPLFRVRNKKKTEYCYSEKERDQAIKRIRGAEVTRFKGLGEISPDEFGDFIGENIRLTPLQTELPVHLQSMMGFFMGKNTEKRKMFILENISTAEAV